MVLLMRTRTSVSDYFLPAFALFMLIFKSILTDGAELKQQENLPNSWNDLLETLVPETCANIVLLDADLETIFNLQNRTKMVSDLDARNISTMRLKAFSDKRFDKYCIMVFVQLKSELHKVYDFGPQMSVQDQFTFYSKDSVNLYNVLGSKPVASRIKSKIGILLQQDNETSAPTVSRVITTCIYCGVNGTSSIISTAPPNLLNKKLDNFHGKLFRISDSMTAKPISEIRLHPNCNKWRFSRGIFKYAWDHISEKYNVSSTYFPATTKGTGRKLPNGTWTGTVGDILNGFADISPANAQIYQRSHVVDYTVPVQYIWMIFATGMPQPNYSWRSIYRPLEPLVWLLILANIATAYLMLVLLLWKNGNTKRIASFMVSTIMEQGGFELDTGNAARTFLAFWLLFQIIVATAYRSKLVSLLTFPVMQEPPKTFQEVAMGSRNLYNVTLQYNRGALYQQIKTSTHPTFRTIFKYMHLEESDSLCFLQTEGKPTEVCIAWNLEYDYVSNKNLTTGQVSLAPDTNSFFSLAFAVPKGAIFKEEFDVTLRVSNDMGLMMKWKELDGQFVRDERRKWEKEVKQNETLYEEGEQFEQNDVLRMEHLTGTFFLLAIGLLISMFGFLSETLSRITCHRLLSENVKVSLLLKGNIVLQRMGRIV